MSFFEAIEGKKLRLKQRKSPISSNRVLRKQENRLLDE